MNPAPTDGTTPGNLIFRPAAREDLAEIIRMLADDPLGSSRENPTSPLPQSYFNAFDSIAADPNNELIVAVRDGRVIAVLQLTFIPSLTYRGSWRAQVDGVRVDSSVRSAGIGRTMMTWVIERARSRGCRLLQLTSDKSRSDAIRFYESLGFIASHEGFKMRLDEDS